MVVPDRLPAFLERSDQPAAQPITRLTLKGYSQDTAKRSNSRFERVAANCGVDVCGVAPGRVAWAV